MNYRKESSGIAAICRRFLFVALMAVVSLSASAQGKQVTGKVLDENGDPMIGVTVVAKGSTNGTSTDFDGVYTLKNVTHNSVLVFSYVGCVSQEAKVGDRSVIDIVMREDSEILEDLIVVGYGVQKKSDVTGALTRVDSETLNSRPVSNALEALQGKAAGVDITTNQRPGEMGSIRIRGNRSLSATNDPLYVVDGVPLQSGGIESINPRDIEAIDILKDASATAIYGSRGANGVVIITTKGGKSGQFSLNYSGSVTTSKIVDRSPSMTAAEFINFRRWAAYNLDPNTYAHPNSPTKENDMVIFDSPLDGQTSRDNVMRGWAAGTWDPSAVIDYDWTDLYTRTGVTQEHTVSASGGTDKMNAYASFGYLDNQGTQKGQWYKRYTGKVTTRITPVKWMQIDASINASWGEQDYGLSGAHARSKSVPTSIYGLAKTFYRYAPMYDANGDIILYPGGENAQYTIVGELEHQKYRRQSFRALGNFAATVKFGEIWSPLKGLTYKIAFGPDYRHYRAGSWIDGMSSYTIQSDGQPGKNMASLENQRAFSWTLDNLINYNNTFAGKHNVGLTLLQTASKYNYENSSMTNHNIPKDSYLWNNMGSASITDANNGASMGSGFKESSLESYMIRVTYNYDERYLLTASGRWDGASQLAPGHKWDFFPSMAVAWRLDQEDFMSQLYWLNNLKVRLGVGVTGNAAVSLYATKGTISQMFLPFGTGSTPAYSTSEDYYNIHNPLANTDLGWEKTTQWNLGLDYGFLNNRIGGSLEFYWSKTNDLLMQMNIPSITGYSTTWANVGKTSNHGVELTINAFPVIAGDFQWETNLNMAYQKNRIDELANGKEDDIQNKWFIGHEIGVIYGYDNLGIWQDTPEDRAEMEKWNANGYNFTPGNVRPKDQTNDYKMTDEDRVIIGNSSPQWTLGWSNNFSWKGIELGFQIIGRLGYSVDAYAQPMTAHANQNVVDYWTPENTGAYYQKPILGQASAGATDPFAGILGLRKGGYIMMRDISLGYNFPKELISKATLKNARVYAQCINPFSFYQAIKGYDLDTNDTFYNRSFVFGLELGF
ncbi:MAG: TonB-dependent receptor [Muribaculaceae bacterium]|nr:TonB-dependent receptor [Muribaculaceae bacterium]